MLIVIDPGHGGKDPGACGNGLKEKDITLELGQLVAAELKNYLVEVLMTRREDVDVSLTERVRIANEKKADFFLSLHVNAGGGTGFESYRDEAAGMTTIRYQKIIHNAVKLYMDLLPDRGKKAAQAPRFYVLRHTSMPAVLLENLFIDHPEEAACLADRRFLGGLARAIAAGVVAALGIKPRVEPEPAWDPQKEIDRLKERGLIAGNKNASSPVPWGELATVLNRLLDKGAYECNR